jgi:hypothetical protein
MHARTRARILDQSMRGRILSGVAVNLSSGGVQFTPEELRIIVSALRAAAEEMRATIVKAGTPMTSLATRAVAELEALRHKASILADKIELEVM